MNRPYLSLCPASTQRAFGIKRFSYSTLAMVEK
jgi:hypothetical protein